MANEILRTDRVHVVPQDVTREMVLAGIESAHNPLAYLAEVLPTSSFPLSLHIIPDGNRRYATAAQLASASEGHQAGAEVLATLVRALSILPIPNLVVWGASPANLTERDSDEVRALLTIMTVNLKKLLPEVIQRQGRIVALGDIDGLPEAQYPKEVKALREALREAEEVTRETNGSGQTVFLAINFDEKTEQRRATKEIERRVKTGEDILSDEAQNVIYDPYDLGRRALILRSGTKIDQRYRGSGWPYMNGGNGSQMEFVPETLPELTLKILAEAITNYAFVKQRAGGDDATQTNERRDR